MRFNKKLSLVTIGMISSLFIGCGGGGSSSDTNSASITASDAYVVSLPTPAIAECDGIDYNSTNVENGIITFNLPKSVDSSNCVYSIPKDAIVDIDGDGKLSEPDQTIRMPLKTKGANTVANPLTTSALTKGDLDNFEKFKEFDPVKAKKHLLENPDDNKTAKLVASADAIAYLADEAEKKGLDVSEVLKDVDTNAIVISVENDDSNISEVVTQVIEPAGKIHNIDTKQIDSKVEETHKAIKELHLAIKNGDINSTDSKEAINAIIAVTDGNVTASEITTAIENKDLKSIIKKVKIDEHTQKERKKIEKDKNKEVSLVSGEISEHSKERKEEVATHKDEIKENITKVTNGEDGKYKDKIDDKISETKIPEKKEKEKSKSSSYSVEEVATHKDEVKEPISSPTKAEKETYTDKISETKTPEKEEKGKSDYSDTKSDTKKDKDFKMPPSTPSL